MKIAIGTDELLPIVNVVRKKLEEIGHDIKYYGPGPDATMPWPQIARQVAEDVAAGGMQEGILFCWTGTGVSIAANKISGIRAALCDDAETARGARLWNNANVLCISMRRTSEAIAIEILESWFKHNYQPNPTDDACLAMIDKLDKERQGDK
jgi:ribose 5-phosphate isomerase B